MLARSVANPISSLAAAGGERGHARDARFPREAGNTCVCPAVGFCGSRGLSDSCMRLVPWFHEIALLEVDGRSVADTEDGAGCAAGEYGGASDATSFVLH